MRRNVSCFDILQVAGDFVVARRKKAAAIHARKLATVSCTGREWQGGDPCFRKWVGPEGEQTRTEEWCPTCRAGKEHYVEALRQGRAAAIALRRLTHLVGTIRLLPKLATRQARALEITKAAELAATKVPLERPERLSVESYLPKGTQP